MNYFEHHIGDYDKNTSHLSACEDGIYCRMIRRYLDKEIPLDADIEEIKRIVRARTREEKKAVDTVLKEFFFPAADGWHHKTCDEIISAYQAGEPEREAKKANEDNRMRKHRDERAALFAALTAAGQHAAWNTNMKDLRALVAALQVAPKPGPETGPATQTATAPATPATATQTPLPTTHYPDITTTSELRPGQPVESSEAKKPKRPKRQVSADDEACARYCFAQVRRLSVDAREPNFASWANDVSLMVSSDNRTHREICELFVWANRDSFWQSNILSPSKLREKWDQLTVKRGTPQKGVQHGNFGKQDYSKGVGPNGEF